MLPLRFLKLEKIQAHSGKFSGSKKLLPNPGQLSEISNVTSKPEWHFAVIQHYTVCTLLIQCPQQFLFLTAFKWDSRLQQSGFSLTDPSLPQCCWHFSRNASQLAKVNRYNYLCTWTLNGHAWDGRPLLRWWVISLSRVQKADPIIATNAVNHVSSDNQPRPFPPDGHPTKHGPLVRLWVVPLHARVTCVAVKTATHVYGLCKRQAIKHYFKKPNRNKKHFFCSPFAFLFGGWDGKGVIFWFFFTLIYCLYIHRERFLSFSLTVQTGAVRASTGFSDLWHACRKVWPGSWGVGWWKGEGLCVHTRICVCLSSISTGVHLQHWMITITECHFVSGF